MAKKPAARPASGAASPVPGLTRGIDILRLFGRQRPVIGAPDMARELGIPRSTVHRLVTVLEGMGLLRRVDGGDFTLDAGVLTLGFEYLGSLDIVELSAPVLADLRDRIGLSTHLVTRTGTDIVYLSRHAGRSTLISSVSVGTRLPAHGSVIGRALLMDMDAAGLRNLYRGVRLERFLPETPGTVAELEALIAADRVRGYSAGPSLIEGGVTTIAAPVRDRSGAIVAAVSASAMGAPLQPEVMHGPLKDQVRQAAARISQHLDAPTVAAPGAKRATR